MELQFIRTCRNQEENSIRGKLKRFEFMEFILRIGMSAHNYRMSPSLCLMVFIELILKPVADKSTFLHERELIKISRPLNKLLFENRTGLEYIYNKIKENTKMLPRIKINDYISKLLKKQYPDFTILEIHKHFVYSLEIVQDEHCDSDKYNYLNNVEYLEFLCRIAIKVYEDRHELEL